MELETSTRPTEEWVLAVCGIEVSHFRHPGLGCRIIVHCEPRSWPGSVGFEEVDEDEEGDGGDDDGHTGGPHRCHGEA